MRKHHTKQLIILLLFVACNSFWVNAKNPIKILAIGNSFSVDAVEQYLYELGAATGDSMVIGNAYISGCSLETHWDNANGNKNAYAFRKIVGGVKTSYSNRTLLHCIVNEDWDYITFQQISANSGMAETYFPYITNLLEYAETHATNPDVQFALHRTWAYAKGSTQSGFANYGRNQLTMYNAIVDATNQVAGQTGIDMIIPSGTAIQNGRTSYIGDKFCRDGFHLSLGLGRYTAACTWYEFFTGKNVVGNPYIPSAVTASEAQIAQNAVHYARLQPDAITSMEDFTDETSIGENKTVSFRLFPQSCKRICDY